jgi:bud site selection protein 20
MGRLRRKGTPGKNKTLYRNKTKRGYKRDLDQIVYEDMLTEATHALLNQPQQEDKPGLGQYYCVTCARYFIAEQALNVHYKTKEHKKRFKIVKNEIPYSIEEAERAGGVMPAKNAPKRVKPQLNAIDGVHK